MERNEDVIDLVDLGVASEETQGQAQGDVDGIGFLKRTGLSDD